MKTWKSVPSGENAEEEETSSRLNLTDRSTL